jgi:hypothetical protein
VDGNLKIRFMELFNGINNHLSLYSFNPSLEYKGDFEKAAGMLFLYHGDLEKTIECLSSSGDERLILIAAALAGGLGSKSNLWKNLCKNLSYQLRDPFLRFLFGLISCDGNWSLVLNETSLPLEDRMLIALKFLDDSLVLICDS